MLTGSKVFLWLNFVKTYAMENIIKTEKGFFAVVERYGKDFKIEMFDPYVNILIFYMFNILLIFLD